jgi:SAM-dependent methyltransferase
MKKIMSEEPVEHWSFLNFKNKIVLDLGCGRFYSSISTAEWFINEGASLVIGVDLSKEPIQNERFIPYAKAISSSVDIEYFFKYKPNVVKCDIEGAEKYLKDVLLDSSVEEIAIEYHDAETKKVCEDFFEKWNFNKIELYQLFNESTDRIGVYHAQKVI